MSREATINIPESYLKFLENIVDSKDSYAPEEYVRALKLWIELARGVRS